MKHERDPRGPMARTSASTRRAMSQAIRHHIKDKGMPQDQAVAVAYAEQRKRGRKVPARKKAKATKATRAAKSRKGRKASSGTRKRT